MQNTMYKKVKLERNVYSKIYVEFSASYSNSNNMFTNFSTFYLCVLELNKSDLMNR